MGLIARRVPRWCDWLIRTFASDEPMRPDGAASAWAWDTLLRENEKLRRERTDYGRAVSLLHEAWTHMHDYNNHASAPERCEQGMCPEFRAFLTAGGQ